MVSTLAGMVTLVSAPAYANAKPSISSNWLPWAKVIDVNAEAPLNADPPMLVTPAGMVIEFKLLAL